MRIPEKYQELYFFLQDIEDELLSLDKKVEQLKDNKSELNMIDKKGISLVHNVRRLLDDLKEFSPYNDMESIWGISINEIKDTIERQVGELEKLIKFYYYKVY